MIFFCLQTLIILDLRRNKIDHCGVSYLGDSLKMNQVSRYLLDIFASWWSYLSIFTVTDSTETRIQWDWQRRSSTFSWSAENQSGQKRFFDIYHFIILYSLFTDTHRTRSYVHRYWRWISPVPWWCVKDQSSERISPQIFHWLFFLLYS